MDHQWGRTRSSNKKLLYLVLYKSVVKNLLDKYFKNLELASSTYCCYSLWVKYSYELWLISMSAYLTYESLVTETNFAICFTQTV